MTSVGPFAMYRALVGVGLFCSLVIVSVYELTRPAIEQNKADALQAALFRVLPEAKTSRTFSLDGNGVSVMAEGQPAAGTPAYAGYDANGRLVGLALRAQGRGYEGLITVLYGYNFDEHAIVGMQVLESRETPGLGDKIEKDPAFLKNFERLDVSLTSDGTRLQHDLEGVKSGEKEHPWQIDCISNATVSSKAVADMLRDSAGQWIPKAAQHRAKFSQEAPQP